VVTDPTNTFYFEAANDDLISFGIKRNAIIVVDRSLPVKEGKMVVANHENEWVIRQLIKINTDMYLITSNEQEKPIKVSDQTIFFGVVTWSRNPLSSN
jgi:DNA polymerase V